MDLVSSGLKRLPVFKQRGPFLVGVDRSFSLSYVTPMLRSPSDSTAIPRRTAVASVRAASGAAAVNAPHEKEYDMRDRMQKLLAETYPQLELHSSGSGCGPLAGAFDLGYHVGSVTNRSLEIRADEDGFVKAYIHQMGDEVMSETRLQFGNKEPFDGEVLPVCVKTTANHFTEGYPA